MFARCICGNLFTRQNLLVQSQSSPFSGLITQEAIPDCFQMFWLILGFPVIDDAGLHQLGNGVILLTRWNSRQSLDEATKLLSQEGLPIRPVQDGPEDGFRVRGTGAESRQQGLGFLKLETA